MSIQDRKERERGQRRNHIIDAAEKVFFTKGLENSTMNEVAKEAELSKGTLYLYFENKMDLHLAICERGSNMLTERFTKIFSGDNTGLELVRMMGETYLDFVRNNPNYFHTFITYEARKDPDEYENNAHAEVCQKNVEKAMNMMVRALQIGMQDGTIDDSYEPKELAATIWASTRGVTKMYHIQKSGHYFKDIDQMSIKDESFFDQFLNLLGCGMATDKGKEKIDQ